jgi:hypothetical protein
LAQRLSDEVQQGGVKQAAQLLEAFALEYEEIGK